MAPHSDSLMGPTDWYRNTLSVTAACVVVRREVFERIGGFDEGFILCGSDVVLGLDAHFLGLRNVVTPFTDIRHHESATRSTNVPESDFFASYWWYQTLAVRRRPAVLAVAVAVEQGAPLPGQARARSPRADRGPAAPGLHGVPPGQRLRRGRVDGRPVPGRRRAGGRRPRAARRAPGPVLAAHRQLVPAGDRQPLLRRRGHRAAHRRPPGHPPRRPEPVHRRRPARTRPSSGRRWRPCSRPSPTRRSPSPRRCRATTSSCCPTRTCRSPRSGPRRSPSPTSGARSASST